ncbi:YebE [Bacillus subtilis QB928]|nr:YebE [Bacillus subtilis QB928]
MNALCKLKSRGMNKMMQTILSNGIAMVLIILIINIVYVSFFTIRMILTLKGQRYLAAGISTIEILVYVTGLSLVLDNLDQIQNVIAYALGYGLGVIVGMKIEEKLALGYIMVNVITKELDLDLPKQLREKGYGVTNWVAGGLEGDRTALQILTPRRYELQLYDTIKTLDSKAFIIAYEPKTIHGGFWVKAVKKRRIKE